MAGYKLRLLVRNLVDEAVLTAVPALLSTLPESILQTDSKRSIAATTTGLAQQDFNLSWTADQTANCIVFSRHNWTTAATFRPYLFQSGSPSVAVYDPGALTAFSPSGLDSHLDDPTLSTFSNELRNSVFYFPRRTDIRSATFRISDAANPAGYISQTKAFFGWAYEMQYHVPFGALDFTWLNRSRASRADDGTLVPSKRWRARKIVLRQELITATDLPTVLAQMRLLGPDKEVFLDVYPELGNAQNLYYRMACRCMDSPALNPWQVGLHRNTYTFEET